MYLLSDNYLWYLFVIIISKLDRIIIIIITRKEKPSKSLPVNIATFVPFPAVRNDTIDFPVYSIIL